MLQADYKYYPLQFKRPAGTSRGVLTRKESWFIRIWDDRNPAVKGIGECSIIPNLSPDAGGGYEEKIAEVCRHIDDYWYYLEDGLREYPSICFGLETAFRDFQNGGKREIFTSDFTKNKAAIPINGLVWMGDKIFMRDQIQEKLEQGYSCIKLKIGAINFRDELRLLEYVRSDFSAETVELRVDANGAFSPGGAMAKLRDLADFQLHSIEQPIRAGQIHEMAELCARTPLPIALDEELIGVYQQEEKAKLLDVIQPQYIILKPSLAGGIKGSTEWIQLADERNTGWWVTSALESNIGLNAIAQWTYTLENKMPQGLGTGQLYTNNIHSPLVIADGKLHYDNNLEWESL